MSESVIDTVLSLKIRPARLSGSPGGAAVCPGRWCRGSGAEWLCVSRGTPSLFSRSERVSQSRSRLVQRSLGCPLDDDAVPHSLCWDRLFHGLVSLLPPWDSHALLEDRQKSSPSPSLRFLLCFYFPLRTDRQLSHRMLNSSVHSFCLIWDIIPASRRTNETNKVVPPVLRMYFGCLCWVSLLVITSGVWTIKTCLEWYAMPSAYTDVGTSL